MRGLVWALALACSAALAAGCGSADRTVMHQRFESVQAPQRVAGTTGRARQGVGTACKLSAVYKVREATGTAYLIQTELVHLRLRPARAGTRYRLDCRGPLVVELPAGATHVEATSGKQELQVRRLTEVRLGPGRPARPQPRKQLVAVDWPDASAATYDDQKLELRLELPDKARLLRERVVYTASVSCGRSSYVHPLVPLIDDLGFVNATTIPRGGKPFDFTLPHLAGGISSHAEVTRTLACPG